MIGTRMGWSMLSLFIIAFLCPCIFTTEEDGLIYMQQHSFGQPFIRVSGGLGFWEMGDNAILTEDYVQLTDAVHRQTGSIWNLWNYPYRDWQATIEFSVEGNRRKGAEGFVFWYTKERSQPGPVFGSKDQWNGLGIFFDTFDNDGKGEHPSIYAIINDGTMTYDTRDGGSDIIGECQHIPYRGNGIVSSAKIVYKDGILTVFYKVGKAKTWNTCFTVPAKLSPKSYFGASASTAPQHADRHILHSFFVHSFADKLEYDDSFDDDNNTEHEQKKREETHVKGGESFDFGKGVDDKDIRDKVSEIGVSLEKHAKEVTKHQQTIAEYLKTILSEGDNMIDESANLESIYSTLRKELSGTQKTLTTGVVDNLGRLKRDISTISNEVSTLSKLVKDIERDISHLRDSLKSAEKDLAANRNEFYIFLALFQATFIFALFLWKRGRDFKIKSN